MSKVLLTRKRMYMGVLLHSRFPAGRPFRLALFAHVIVSREQCQFLDIILKITIPEVYAPVT